MLISKQRYFLKAGKCMSKQIWQKTSLATIAKEVKAITKGFSTTYKYNKVRVLLLSIWQ